MKRPAPWVARRIATQKALRALPKCEGELCDKRGIGFVTVRVERWHTVKLFHMWLCPEHAQRAQREKR